MSKMSFAVAVTAALAGMSAVAALPTVSNVRMSQPGGRNVLVTYDLANGPAVVTLDIETNGPNGWVSIGLEKVYAFDGAVSGDANRKVSGTSCKIYWLAAKAWPDMRIGAGGARAKLTAWPMDDTPDYMVVDLRAGANTADRVRYYVSTNSLPGGGLFGNEAYRTTHLALKITLDTHSHLVLVCDVLCDLVGSTVSGNSSLVDDDDSVADCLNFRQNVG